MTLSNTSVPSVYENNIFKVTSAGSAPGIPNIGTYLARTIGDEPSGNRAFGGKIACAYFYNRVLSLSEITQNYNAQKSRFNLT
jgi:hypothetical protein